MDCLCPGTTDDHSCACPAPNPRGAEWDEKQAFGLPHLRDECFCARDNVAEPFSTCGNSGSGCGGCTDEVMCSLAPGCSFTSAACTCDSGYSVSTLCDGAGNLQTFFFVAGTDPTCDDPSSAAGVFDTPIDEDDGGRCDHRGRQGSEEDGWYELYGREASCQGVAAGLPPRAAYYVDDSGCDGEPLPAGDPRIPHGGSTWEGLKNCACCEPRPRPSPPPIFGRPLKRCLRAQTSKPRAAAAPSSSAPPSTGTRPNATRPARLSRPRTPTPSAATWTPPTPSPRP